jgi:hypothetical protein
MVQTAARWKREKARDRFGATAKMKLAAEWERAGVQRDMVPPSIRKQLV